MSYKKIILLGSVLIMLLVGCGLREDVVQKEPKSFLWFTGNIQNAVVYIDDLAPIVLTGEVKGKKRKQVHYAVSPGKHTIIVKKSGEEVVNRNLLLGSGITKEIQIP
jgi:hypothetical protein